MGVSFILTQKKNHLVTPITYLVLNLLLYNADRFLLPGRVSKHRLKLDMVESPFSLSEY